MVNGGCERNVGVGEQDMGRDDTQIRNTGLVNRKRLAINDRGVDGVFAPDLRVVGEQNLRGVGLAVDVDEERRSALARDTRGERDGGSSFACAGLLGSYRKNHMLSPCHKAPRGGVLADSLSLSIGN